MSRKLLIVLAIPLLLVLLVVILVPLLLDEDKLLALAAEQVREKTGATLRVDGDTHIGLFPRLALALGEVSLQMPAETEPGLRAQRLAIGVQLFPLLRRELVIDSIELDGVDAKIISEPAPAPLDTTELSDAELKAFYDTRREAMRAAGESAGAANALAIPLALNVGKFTIDKSRVTLSERGSSEQTVIELLQVTASGLNLAGAAIPLQAHIRLPGDTPLELQLEARLAIDQQSQQATIESLRAVVTGALAEPLEVEASGPVLMNQQVADLQLDASTGTLKAKGKLRYASFESPQINANLHLNEFTPAIFAVAGPEAAAAGAEDAPAEAGDTPLPLNALRAIDTLAVLRIDSARFSGHELTELNARLRAVDGLINLSRVTGKLHGGDIDFRASLNARSSTAKLNSEGGLDNADIAAGLAASGVQDALTGRASLNWKLHASGNSTNALTRSLRGPVELTTQEAVLTAVGVEQKLCQAVALVNQERMSAQLPDSSPFQQLSATINLGGGKARLQPLAAQFPDIGLTGQGEMDLLSLDFKASFAARLSAGLSELDPACRVNQRLTAIDWPVRCKGNIGGEPKEWCSIDSGDIVRDLATDEVKRKAKKELQDKLGDGAGDALKKLFGN